MNKISIKILKGLRKVYLSTFAPTLKKPIAEQDPDKASKLIYDALTSDEPKMIARFGSTELTCLTNYLSVKYGKGQYVKFITGKGNAWWWDFEIIKQMQDWSGFFPATIEKIESFCQLFYSDISEVDVLGSWLPQEDLYFHKLNNASKVNLELLNPYFSKEPWTRALEGKKVLVVHPFADTIEEQYKKRTLLFENNLLPEFKLTTIKAIQSIAGEKTKFADWFEALEHMKAEIEKVEFDICLIGCGAYGFSLAAHVKRIGKKGFHIGGSLQLLFGIRGKRWEDASYNEKFNYSKLINKYWVKPGSHERPSNANVVEGACYW